MFANMEDWNEFRVEAVIAAVVDTGAGVGAVVIGLEVAKVEGVNWAGAIAVGLLRFEARDMDDAEKEDEDDSCACDGRCDSV